MTCFGRAIRNSFLALIIFSFGILACAKAQVSACPGLKIGVLFTSDDIGGKSELDEGYQQALKEINAKGIAGGCKIELIYPKNQKVVTADIAKDVQDLVDQGALVILSAQTDDASKRIAKVSNYLNIPVVIPVDTGDEILTSGETPWFVRINPKNDEYASAVMNYVASRQLSAPPRFAILFEQTEYGESSAVVAGKAVLANNMAIGLYQRYSPFLTDFSEIAGLLTKTEPSVNVVYLVSTQPKQASLLLKELAKVKTSAGSTMVFDEVFGLGSAFTSREFMIDVAGSQNPILSNLILPVPWSADAKWKGLAQCTQAALPSLGANGIQDPVVRNIQGYVGLALAANGIDQLAKKSNWKINDKTVSDWKEMLRNPDYLPVFRTNLAQVIRSTSACQVGSQLWPISFTELGQNQRPALLAKLIDGKLTLLETRQ